MRRLLFLILTQLLATGTCDISPGPEQEGKHEGKTLAHWNYEDQDWVKGYPYCNGDAQSPINIDTRKTIVNKELPSITLEGYNLKETEQLDLSNNGHTVQLSLPDSMSISGGFTQKYLASQLHFHWGSESTPGSEHTVDGTQYAAEMHIVHFAAKYESLVNASQKADGLAVLAVFLQVGTQHNKNYDHIFDKLQDIAEGATIKIPGFDISTLLPSQLHHFFRYTGSLTTPPCFQTVTWTVFNEVVLISQVQLEKLKTSLKANHHTLDSNFRQVQPLNRRSVFASFSSLTSSRSIVPNVGFTESDGNDNSANGNHFTLGDTLAVIFGTLFGCTALAFAVYVLKQKKQRSNTERGQKVIYKPAATMEA
ncbi:carbonic anhydrase 14 isoform X1 [Chiloscyllium plagiosum]|uniref:carbonic anhydrase 14 isoform X1 n=1 Tax=Chiloscyllium plagiosum TaxID=36176 RepID=UPI001CB83DD9|nr:carbonic anhydrase 14 isoform X1 [Chiloscyllium plagiosum]